MVSKSSQISLSLLGILFGGVATASTVSLGSIGAYAGLGVTGYQSVYVFNQTGQGDCSQGTTYALSCDAFNFTNWSLEVDFTALVNGQQVAQSPVFNSSATCTALGCDIISPGNDPTTSPLYSLPYSVTNPCCDTLVTKVIFTATVPNLIHIWNPGDNAQSTFQPQTPFTFTAVFSATPEGQDYLAGNVPAYLTDLLVTDAQAGGGPPAVPEPGTWVLTVACALAFGWSRLRATRSRV